MAKPNLSLMSEEELSRFVADHKLHWAVGLLEAAKDRRFFGKLTFIFEDGHVQRCVNEQNLKPPPMSGSGQG